MSGVIGNYAYKKPCTIMLQWLARINWVWRSEVKCLLRFVMEKVSWSPQPGLYSFLLNTTHKHTRRETGETTDMGIYLMPSIENWIALKQINWCNLQEQGLQADRKLTLHLGLLNYSVPKRDQPPCIKMKSSLQASRPIWWMTALIQISVETGCFISSVLKKSIS